MIQWDEIANSIQKECKSTNDLAKQLAELNYPHGTWVSAERQTQGRGRSGNQWISEKGNLFLSIILRHVSPKVASWVPLMTGVSICKTLKPLSLDLKLKWPNDLFIKNKKVGGILCEGFSHSVIVGIGLNCKTAPIFGISLQELTNRELSLDHLRIEILQGLLKEYLNLTSKGFSSIKALYESLAFLPIGSQIQWNQERTKGVIRGLGDQGELIVQTENGTLSLYSGEIFQVRVKSNQS